MHKPLFLATGGNRSFHPSGHQVPVWERVWGKRAVHPEVITARQFSKVFDLLGSFLELFHYACFTSGFTVFAFEPAPS